MNCGTDNFNYTNKYETILKGVSVGKCVKDKSWLQVRSIFSANHFNMVEVRFVTCMNSTANNNSCLPEADIRKYLAGVNICFLNLFLDLFYCAPYK